jgi:hypothetical protein
MIRLAEQAALRVRELGRVRFWHRRRDGAEHPAAQRPGRAPVSEAEVLAALRPIVDPALHLASVRVGGDERRSGVSAHRVLAGGLHHGASAD